MIFLYDKRLLATYRVLVSASFLQSLVVSLFSSLSLSLPIWKMVNPSISMNQFLFKSSISVFLHGVIQLTFFPRSSNIDALGFQGCQMWTLSVGVLFYHYTLKTLSFDSLSVGLVIMPFLSVSHLHFVTSAQGEVGCQENNETTVFLLSSKCQ